MSIKITSDDLTRSGTGCVPVHPDHWLSAAPDSLLLTELSRSPLVLASGTICQILFRSRIKTHMFNKSYHFPLWLYSACTVTSVAFGHYYRPCLLERPIWQQWASKAQEVNVETLCVCVSVLHWQPCLVYSLLGSITTQLHSPYWWVVV